jgi:hypothetical protein
MGFGWRGEEEIIGVIFLRQYVSGFGTARIVY